MAIASKGRGKSHGARIITFTALVTTNDSDIILLTIYDQSERESISKQEVENILLEIGLK